MKYTKSWTVESEAAQDPWHQWLAQHSRGSSDHQLLYWEDHIEVEFFSEDLAQAFALEFGL